MSRAHSARDRRAGDKARGRIREPRAWRPRACRDGRTGAHHKNRDHARRVADLRGQDIRRRRRSEEHTSELQSRLHLVCRLLLEKKKKTIMTDAMTTKQSI